MAITIEVSPNKFESVFRNIPINVEVSSDQFGSDVFVAISVANNGLGKCRITIGAHNVLNNGVVTGTGFIGQPTYNVRHTVTGIGGAFIDTDIDFVGDDSGTITRTNDNFQIRMEVRNEFPSSVFIGDKVATVIVDTSRFRFNPANLLTSELSHDLEAVGLTNLTSLNGGSLILYSLKYIEEFNDSAGLLQQQGTITDTTVQAVNSTRQYLDSDQTLDEYVIDAVSEHKFLTNAPLIQKIALTEDAQLSFIFDLAGSARIRWERYNAAGALHDTQTLSPVGPGNFRMTAPINDILFDVATLPDISKIVVWIIDDSANQVTEQRTFNIDNRCFSNPVRFHFLNKLGGFDSYTFTGNRKETLRTKQVGFTKDLGLTFNIGDRGLSTLAVETSFVREVWSDFLNEADRIWLTELFTSPEIVIQEGTDLIPVVRKTTQIQFINDNRLTQLRIRYEMPKQIIQTN